MVHRVSTQQREDMDYATYEGGMTMNESKSATKESVTKDPVCGMTVDEATAPHAERDGKTFYFCGDHCRRKFLSTPAGA